MQRDWVLKAPLSIPQSKKKNFSINFNVYRNAHFQTLNTVKKRYKEALTEQINELPEFTRFRLRYIFYPGRRYNYDVANVCSVHDKFFCDALQECGKVPDDNYNHLPEVTYQWGDFDKEDPRVEIHLHILE